MKTPQEAAREYMQNVLNDSDLSVNYEEDNYDAGVMHTLTEALEPAFLAGDAFGYRRGIAEAQRWINVEDELPENESPVIAKIKTVETEEDEIIYGVCAYIGNGIWVNQFGVVHGLPTHWRPIEPVNK